MSRVERFAFRLAAVQGTAMAVYHFFLPTQFGWSSLMSPETPTITWALFALNNYFSFNLLALSLVFAWSAFRRPEPTPVLILCGALSTLFWVFSVAYQVFEPMPLPSRLAVLGFVLPALAAVNAVLSGWPTIRVARRMSGRPAHLSG